MSPILVLALYSYMYSYPVGAFDLMFELNVHLLQGSHKLEKYLNIQDCLENEICLEKYLKNTQMY